MKFYDRSRSGRGGQEEIPARFFLAPPPLFKFMLRRQNDLMFGCPGGVPPRFFYLSCNIAILHPSFSVSMSIEVFQERVLPMKDKLFRFALRLLQNVQEAEDVIQDVMAGVWVKREEWGQWKSLEAYCMAATRNQCIDRIRKQQYRREKEKTIPTAEAQDPFEKMMSKEMTGRIRQVMAALPENQQLVMHLREVEGFS